MKYLAGHCLLFSFRVNGGLREPVASMERREIRYRGDEGYGVYGACGLRLTPPPDHCRGKLVPRAAQG